jgi:heat shock protein HtpX
MTAYQQIGRNKRRTAFLMAIFFAFLFVVGFFAGEYYGVGGVGGLFYAGVLSIVMALFSYFAGDKVSLAVAGAHQIETVEENPYVWRLVENLAITAGLPMPKVYLIEDAAMNAFATGRDPKHASVALTTGLVEGLEDEELEGVIAHELSHIGNYDTRLMMVVVVLVGAISLLADFTLRMHWFGGRRERRGGGQLELILMVVGLVLIVLSPIIAELIKLAISRKREYLADASAVLLTRYADGLASALEKIAGQGNVELTRANHATAHLYLVNPFSASKTYSRLFSTHPPIEERIAALRNMGGTGANAV